MAAFVLLLFILALTTSHSDATWCACRPEADSPSLQRAIDYACGNGADCSAILQGGVCFQPNTLRAHCNYAVNSYFQRKAQATGSCIFSNTAAVTQTDPGSSGSCIYPSTSSSTGGTGTTPGGTGLTPPGGITPPLGFNTPTTGGGVGFNSGGLGPSSINTDSSGADRFQTTELLLITVLLTLLISLQG